jgi:hypothetical protein
MDTGFIQNHPSVQKSQCLCGRSGKEVERYAEARSQPSRVKSNAKSKIPVLGW